MNTRRRDLIADLPEELRDLPFGSPEFKDENERLGQQEMDDCAEVMRAMPSFINLTGTTVCNLRCFMCTHGIDPAAVPRWFMTDEVYDRVLEELYPFVKSVQFSAFGEPLMTPKLESKLDDLERTHTKLDIVTNATLMKTEKVREKLLHALDCVTFSLDGATAEIYNKVRIGADFDRVMHNIRAFCSRRMELPENERPRLAFNFILMKCNVHEAAQFVELAASLGAQQITFNHLVVFDKGLEGESLVNHRELSNECLREVRATADRLLVPITIPPLFGSGANGSNGSNGANRADGADGAKPEVVVEDLPTPRQADGPGLPPVKCMFLWRRAYISVNGDVIPCCLAGVPSFGNMMEGGFAQVWNSETYQTYRRHVYTPTPHEMCKNCYLIYPSPDQVEEEGFFKF